MRLSTAWVTVVFAGLAACSGSSDSNAGPDSGALAESGGIPSLHDSGPAPTTNGDDTDGGASVADAGDGPSGSTAEAALEATAGTEADARDGGASDAAAGDAPGTTSDGGMSSFRCNPDPGMGSDVSLPGPYAAPPETRRGPGVPSGAVFPSATQTSTYNSTIFGYAFEYQIYVPAQYDAKRPAALMVFHDGVSLYRGARPTNWNPGGQAKFLADAVLDNLIAAGDIPVSIGLFIEPTGRRADEYDSPDDKFPRFLTDEIIPDVILSKYSIVRDPQAWASIGWSSGGIVSFRAAWYKNAFFQKVIGANASWPNVMGRGTNYIDVVRNAPAKPMRIVLLSGTNDAGGWRMTNMAMVAAERAKGNATRYVDGTGPHFPPTEAAADLPNALRWLWQGCR
jgi:enterochelin esterase-like enzyme